MANEEELRRLEEELSALMGRREELEADARRWIEEREKHNGTVKTLIVQARESREKRDAVIPRVRELRSEIQRLRKEINEKSEELKGLIQRLTEVKQNLTTDRRILERRIKQLDWEVMTTPTREMLEREEEIVKEIDGLRSQLRAHDKVEELEAQRLELRTGIMADQVKYKELREELENLTSESRMHHEKMVEVSKKIDQVKQKADEAHKKVLETKEQLKKVGKETFNLHRRLQNLKKEREKGERERLKEEAVRKIREKLGKGGKLTFEEFKLLSEVERR